MKICVAQITSMKGNIQANIDKHIDFIQAAIEHKSDLIVFPELSLSGYHPTIAKEFTDVLNDSHIEVFQKISNHHNISIGIGLPTVALDGINIGMIIFRPNKESITYSKQQLHSDELPYFVEGKKDVLLEIQGMKIGLGICYESLQESHIERVHELGAEVLIASVAKSQNGIEKAERFFPIASKEFNIHVLMSNCIGICEDFTGAGQSAIWNENGEKIEELPPKFEGILIYDLNKKSASKKIIH